MGLEDWGPSREDGWPWSEGVPLVAEARGAVVLDVEEDPVYVWIRNRFLARAGIVERELCLEDARALARAWTWQAGVEEAVARRLADPEPDLVILCRNRTSEGAAIRQVERDRGLRPVPILLAGGITIPEMAWGARRLNAGGILRMQQLVLRPPDSFGAALVETVLRLGWPDAFADACRAVGEDVAARPWPEGTAPAPN